MRQRAVPDASGKLSSFSGERQGSKSVPQNSWRVYCCCRLSVFHGRHYCRQPSYYELILQLSDESSSNFTELHALTQAARSYML